MQLDIPEFPTIYVSRNCTVAYKKSKQVNYRETKSGYNTVLTNLNVSKMFFPSD